MLEKLEKKLIEVKKYSSELSLIGSEKRKLCLDILASKLLSNSKKVIKVNPNSNSLAVELPPKNQNAHMSCNAAMIYAGINKCSPLDLAEVIKKHLLMKKWTQNLKTQMALLKLLEKMF